MFPLGAGGCHCLFSCLPWQHSNMLRSQICLALSPVSSRWHAFQRSRLETIKDKITGNSYMFPKIMHHSQESGLAYVVSIFANGTNSPPRFCVLIHRWLSLGDSHWILLNLDLKPKIMNITLFPRANLQTELKLHYLQRPKDFKCEFFSLHFKAIFQNSNI